MNKSGKNKRGKPVIYLMIPIIVVVNLYTKYDPSTLNCCSKIFFSTECMVRQKKEQIKWRTNRRKHYSILQYNFLLSTCIPNMNFLSYTLGKISLTIKYGEKEKRIHGRTNRPVLYLTIQQVIVNSYISMNLLPPTVA